MLPLLLPWIEKLRVWRRTRGRTLRWKSYWVRRELRCRGLAADRTSSQGWRCLSWSMWISCIRTVEKWRTTKLCIVFDASVYIVERVSLSTRTRYSSARRSINSLSRLMTFFRLRCVIINASTVYPRGKRDRNKYPIIFYLILIELAIFVLLFTLVLKGDDDETHEDVHHEKCYDDDVDDVVGCHDRPKVVNRSVIFLVRIDRPIQKPAVTITRERGLSKRGYFLPAF